ncbi:MAG: DUF2461 domain-containing protein [Deltaproteobacteria bacterium]|nr:DUF2461 domain-containing protein [Deltaproteobacteria bacterium]
MRDVPRFSGFPKEALQFFKAIKKNNNRKWFEAHKKEYEANVLAPAEAFVSMLGPRLRSLSRDIRFDPRTSGTGSVKRIYRDTRFSKHKTPYKTYLGILFWQGNRKAKKENPGFLFHLDADGGRLFAGLYGFPPDYLKAYRESVDDSRRGKELARVLESIAKKPGYTTGEPSYKRVPQGYAADHPRAELLRHGNLYALSPRIPASTVSSPKLLDACFMHCKVMAPLVGWMAKV